MRLDDNSLARIVILVLAVSLVTVAITYSMVEERSSNVLRKFTGCVSSMCVDGSTGEHCISIPSRISEVVVEESIIDKKLTIRVTSSKDRCY